MSIPEDFWADRLHAAVDDHPGAHAFDVRSYVTAGRKRGRRRRASALAATAAVIATAATLATNGMGYRGLQPATPMVTSTHASGPDTIGWVAVGTEEDIVLLRPGAAARRIEVAGWDTADEACPSWSPDGTRLMFGRLMESSQGEVVTELVVVPVASDGAISTPRIIPLDGFFALPGFEPYPCGTWAPDGRWVALKGPGEVWLVDTQSDQIRRLPDLRPLDLAWRPGTDQLAIAGDMGDDRGSAWRSTPVSIYTVSTGELHSLGSVKAGNITWSPDGATLAYTGVWDPELRLVNADGGGDRVLVEHPGTSIHGIGPVWSPAGDRIVYQRTCCASSEGSEVVLVTVADGSMTVIAPPTTEGPAGTATWYPWFVTWAPDGTTLLYAAWAVPRFGQVFDEGLIVLSADEPGDAIKLPFALTGVVGDVEHGWVRTDSQISDG